MSERRRTRRKRRQQRMNIRSRGKFRVRHKTKSGRTGKVHHTNLKGQIHEAEKRREKD